MEEADTKQTAIEQAESLEEDLGRLTERLQEQEDLTMGQQVAYENRLEELQRELQQLTSVKMKVESEYSTLKKTVKEKEQEEERRKSKYEVRFTKIVCSSNIFVSWLQLCMTSLAKIALLVWKTINFNSHHTQIRFVTV